MKRPSDNDAALSVSAERNGQAPAPARPLGGLIRLHPFFIEAKNELVRPDRTVFCSEYFVDRWVPTLGARATAVVLFLRRQASGIRDSEAVLQVKQEAIAQAAGCSVRQLFRELDDNRALATFIQKEQRFVRNAKGHVRQTESVYRIAMDDPILPEDETRLDEIIARREAEATAPKPDKVIAREDESVLGLRVRQPHARVVGQGVRLRSGTCSDSESEHVSESYKVKDRIVSETASGDGSALAGDSGTTRISQSLQAQSIEEWRRMTEELARHSARELGDTNSLGYHIQVWNHARKHDRMNGGPPVLADGVFDILHELCERRSKTPTHPSQGKAWTRRTRRWFDDNGVPMLSKAEKDEAAEIRRVIATAPFMQRDPEEQS